MNLSGCDIDVKYFHWSCASQSEPASEAYQILSLTFGTRRGDTFLLWLFPIVGIIIVIILRSVNFRAGESKSSLLNRE